MRVQDVMVTNVRSCRPETNLAEAVREMWEADCGVLPVIGSDDRVIGVITDRDICVAVATKGRPADRIAVREVAHDQHVHTCLAADDIAGVLKTMETYQVRRLPVVDADGHLRGMVSLNDIATRPKAATPAQLASTLAGVCRRRGGVVAASAV